MSLLWGCVNCSCCSDYYFVDIVGAILVEIAFMAVVSVVVDAVVVVARAIISIVVATDVVFNVVLALVVFVLQVKFEVLLW